MKESIIIIQSTENTIHITPKEDINLKDKAVNAINELLAKENIVKILYIDDKFDEDQQKEFFLGRMNYAKNSGNIPSDLDTFQPVEWDKPDAVFRRSIESLWFSSNNKNLLIHEICGHIGNIESSNIIPVLEIEETFRDKVKLFSPYEWTKQYEAELSNLGENENVLCLFDFELQSFRGPNGEENGVQLAKTIKSSSFQDKIYCGIFSHKYKVNEEDDYRNQYAITYKLNAKEFYTISKERFAFDPKLAGFAEGIKHILSLKYIEELKEKSLCILVKSIEKSFPDFMQISPKTFNQIVQKASLEEGIWEIDTFFRLYSIINNYNNYKSIITEETRSEFNASIHKIRDLDAVNTKYKYNDKDEKAIELRNKEVFFNGEILNQLHYPIANGDIFRIGSKEYILLVQPCNLTLRSDGKRNYEYDKGILIPIKLINKDKVNSLTQQSISDAKVPNDQKLCAIFPNYKIISLNILDLAVFESEGKCTINLNKETINDNQLIHSPWKKRYEKVYKIFAKDEKVLIAFNNLRSKVPNELKNEINTLSPYFKKPYCIKDFSIGSHVIYNHQTRVIDFNIQRIRNYREKFSMDLLQGFLHYLSRNAFDIDFSNVE